MITDTAIFSVDFNEMLEPDLVLLSKEDIRNDSNGCAVSMQEGMKVTVYEYDIAVDGSVDNLIAYGVVEKNRFTAKWGGSAKWCCRIDGHGIRHQSELPHHLA
jgi:hypothetical protein